MVNNRDITLPGEPEAKVYTYPPQEAGVNLSLPPEPANLKAAVKDYLGWLRDIRKPMNHHNFDAIKQRVIFKAIAAIEEGQEL